MYSTFSTDPARHAQALRNSKRVSWDIDHGERIGRALAPLFTSTRAITG
jgi:hypothetical protein